MIRIAIDGPGGAGKSSLAKAVASKLGIIYVDTGALYRTIGLYMLNAGINPGDAESVVPMLDKFTLALSFKDGKQCVLLDGVDVGDTIRTPEVSMAASAVSAIPAVREFLLNTQRNIAKENSVIMDGRDIGTVILPDAEVKIFLTASPEARAKRRYEELKAKGQSVSYDQVYKEMAERDKNDSTRAIAPCVPAADSIMLDNSRLTPDGTVKKVISIIKKAERKRSKSSRLYMSIRGILAPLFRFIFKVKVTGAENIPKNGGFILCSNHIAKRDVVLIGAACPRPLKFIAKKELFSIPVLSGLIRALGAIGVNRGGNDVGAIRTAIQHVERGDIVAIFPQGHRRPGINPAETELRNGAGLIAFRAKAPMLPVCIKTKGIKYRLFRQVEIIFGNPISYDELGFTNGGNVEYLAATGKVFDEVIKLGGYDAGESNAADEGEH